MTEKRLAVCKSGTLDVIENDGQTYYAVISHLGETLVMPALFAEIVAVKILAHRRTEYMTRVRADDTIEKVKI